MLDLPHPERVDVALFQLTLAYSQYFYIIGNMETKTVVEQLAALAQETRLAAWRLLVEAGPAGLTVGSIGEALGVPPATLSFHLKTLANAGLVTTRQEGRFIHCVADFSVMHGLLGFLGENCCGGADCSPATVANNKRKSA